MRHLFKVPLQNSDMFISEITDEHITYTIRDTQGNLLEPESTSEYKEVNGKVEFGNRYIQTDYFNHIKNVLQ
jgi:hypothetical protein